MILKSTLNNPIKPGEYYFYGDQSYFHDLFFKLALPF